MTPSFPSLRRREPGAPSAEQLSVRADALARVLDAGGDLLEERPAASAREVVTKVEERTALVGGHTVVALAGATGSGKSSLFNALVGEEASQVGMLRPTTSRPSAAVWGSEPAGALLDWLGVGSRHLVSPDMPGAEDLDGLILLDLPDVDSRERSHREEAQRVLRLVDVFVWVTDPQKYADAVLHDDYVSVLRDYDAVTVVVLNQVDRLPVDGVDSVLGDLGRLLTADGLRDAEVIPTSTVAEEGRGAEGIETLRTRIGEAVARADATRHRLGADLQTSAHSLRPSLGELAVGDRPLPTEALVAALSRAAGVPTVLDAVERDFRLESVARTGWPFTRWVRGLRPAPLRRLCLDKTGEAPDFTEHDVRAVLGRSSIPPPAPSARAAVDLASRRLGEAAAEGLPPRWADAVIDASRPDEADLGDRLDQAVVATPLRGRAPLWWAVFGGLQVLLAAAAVVGLLWLLLITVAGWLQLPEIPTFDVGPFATPFLLLVGGLLGGLALAALARWLAGIGARRRSATVGARLRRAIGDVATSHVVTPVRGVLNRHSRAQVDLDRVLS